MIKARVTEAHRTNFTIQTDGKELIATVRGNFHEEKQFPKVGDYVEVSEINNDQAVIESIVDRSSIIKRKNPDTDEEQVMVANVDLIIIVMGLDNDYNLSRLERYLLLARQSGIDHIVLLNKTDLVDDLDAKLTETKSTAGTTPVYAVSALSDSDLEVLKDHLHTGETTVLLGSSGAGKSTITNWLLNEDKQEVKETRGRDDRGRHTTTSRQLFRLPNGAFLIDTPGMRELGMVETDSQDELLVFEKIEDLSSQCKFRNCDHDKSAGCAIQEALTDGRLSARELTNYHKILRERSFVEDKEISAAERFNDQNQKRKSQQLRAQEKQRLSRR